MNILREQRSALFESFSELKKLLATLQSTFSCVSNRPILFHNPCFHHKLNGRTIVALLPTTPVQYTETLQRNMQTVWMHFRPISSMHNFKANILNTQSSFVRLYHMSPSLAAGHNKWSKIKHRKAVADKERSKMFGRFTGLIITAVRIGGSNLDTNVRLENAILQAKQAGVPKTTIEKAIRSATAKRSSSAEFCIYDAMGPSGYHMLIKVLTDNRRKTRPQIKNLLSKHSGLLGEPGSSSFVFEHKGVVCIPKSELKNGTDPLELAIEVGAEDIIEDSCDGDVGDENDTEGEKNEELEVGVVSEQEECIQLKCEPADLSSVSEAVKSKGLAFASSSLEYLPKTFISLEKVQYERAVHLVELLSEHEDVVEVYDNFTLNKNAE